MGPWPQGGGPVEGSVLTLFWGVFTGGQVDRRPTVLQNNNPMNPSYHCTIHGTSTILALSQPTEMQTKAWTATDVIRRGLQYLQRLCKRSLHGIGWSYSCCRQEALSKSLPVGRTCWDEQYLEMQQNESGCVMLYFPRFEDEMHFGVTPLHYKAFNNYFNLYF